jgi:hypothetical protein
MPGEGYQWKKGQCEKMVKEVEYDANTAYTNM